MDRWYRIDNNLSVIENMLNILKLVFPKEVTLRQMEGTLHHGNVFQLPKVHFVACKDPTAGLAAHSIKDFKFILMAYPNFHYHDGYNRMNRGIKIREGKIDLISIKKHYLELLSIGMADSEKH